MDAFTIKDGKKLRCGYTTGTCATAASKAAARMLLTHTAVSTVTVTTPKHIVLSLEVEDISRQSHAVSCAIRKDAGDDPDITNGMLVYSTVERIDQGIEICGGCGVGRITKAGLACRPGDWAINPTPRRMIRDALEKTAAELGYTGGFRVTLSMPDGEKLAKKTFNPRLGIEGGLSILGTSGIVEPMSEQALIDTIHTEMDARCAAGQRHLLAFFGNYGVDFSRDTLQLDVSQRVTISNYVGEMLDYAVYKQFQDVLLIGHVGKLVKVGQGIMNTHSRYADGRTTLLALMAILQGADAAIGQAVYDSITTDEALRILQEHHLLPSVMTAVCDKIEHYMKQRVHGQLIPGAVMFSNVYGVLGYTSQAKRLLAYQQHKEVNP